jgi:threonine/homoserine/homoserine lactone efflux protein
MSFLTIFLQGLLLGFSIAAPVGPIGVLCIRRTLAEGRLVGFLSGLGAATADMFFGAIAAFGLTALSDILVGQKLWLGLIGGLFLVYLGVKTFLTKPADTAASAKGTGLLGAYLSTLALTLTNPVTILAFTGMFIGMQFNLSGSGSVPAATLVLGVFLGSAAWWLTLSWLVGILREKFTTAWMQWVNRLSGAIIFAFGVAVLVSTWGASH